MKKRILQRLQQLAHSEEITIHCAIESGSRAWGYPSLDSDYDVRFFYTRPPGKEVYFRNRLVLTIDVEIEDELDLNGWDLRKALILARKSNAVIWEWLQSPIIYSEEADFRGSMLKTIEHCFYLPAALYHYRGMSRSAIAEIQNQSNLRLKTYLYTVRQVLALVWLIDTQSIPPMDIGQLLEPIDAPEFKAQIAKLIALKAQAREKDEIKTIPVVNDFLLSSWKRIPQEINRVPEILPTTAPLDEFIYGVTKGSRQITW